MSTIQIEWLNIQTLTDADLALVAAALPQRYGRATAFVRRDDYLRCIGAGLLMLRLGLRSESDIEYGPHGKPTIPYLPQFNISHSGDWVVCAASNAPIGVDIERIQPDNLVVAQEVFVPQELNWMHQCDSDQRFCQLWTLKEAVMKFFGKGLHLEPKSFNVMPFVQGKALTMDGATIYAHTEIRDDYTLSVVSTEHVKA